MAAFRLAIRLGASGLESDVWLTKDGVAVLAHDGWIGSRLRRRTLSDVDRAELPDHVPTLDDLLELADHGGLAVSLDVKDPAGWPTVRAAVLSRPALIGRTYVCCENFALLERVASENAGLLLVDSSRLSTMREGPERRLARLAELGVVALNMHHSDWNGGLVALAHRFGRLALAWDAQFEHTLVDLLRMGIDGVYSDWVDRMVDAGRAEFLRSPS